MWLNKFQSELTISTANGLCVLWLFDNQVNTSRTDKLDVKIVSYSSFILSYQYQ